MEDLDNPEIEGQTVRLLCTTMHQVEKWKDAIEWCTKGLGLDGEGENVAMLVARAESYLKLEDIDGAEREANRVLSLQRNNRQAHVIIQQVQRMRKMATRKDYYKILGVAKESSEADVKRAYKKLARKW